MSIDAPDPRRDRAASVGVGANAVGAGSKRRGVRYPEEWKECCREIFAEYQVYLSEKLGAPVGWGRIRNLVMREQDARLGYPDEQLRRQDLEHWVLKGKVPGDAKFKFVDRYLHEELLAEETDFRYAAARVIAYRGALQHRSMRTLYMGDRREPSSALHAFTDRFAGKLYAMDEPAAADENFRAALYVQSSDTVRYLAVAFSFKFTPAPGPAGAGEIIAHGHRHFGYLMPMNFADALQGEASAYGVLKLFERSLLATKEAVFHTSAHCFLNGDGGALKIAPLESVTRPFRAVTKQTENPDAVRRLMALTQPQLYPRYGLQADFLRPMEITSDQQEILQNLHDEYLLW
jgi:hypothetical protein